MPNNELDDEVDPLNEEDDVVDAADEEDDEFEDDEEEDEDDDVEDGGDIEARAAFTQEIGSEGGSPGEDMEIFRAGRNTAGSEASETMPGGSRGRSVERRDEEDVLIKRVP